VVERNKEGYESDVDDDDDDDDQVVDDGDEEVNNEDLVSIL
jgi:hypothetical protein